jgi:catechol 2,3-dioxygenase-like lactoylglutathione lyase family enzyme
MIQGLHAMFYTTDAAKTRAFLRDKLGFPYTDVGGGWLIFDVPSADVGCHPSDKKFHEMSFYCDDIESTVADLKAKGVKFTSKVSNQGWGMAARFDLPGVGDVTLYQPLYEKKKAKSTAAKSAAPKSTAAKAKGAKPRTKAAAARRKVAR